MKTDRQTLWGLPVVESGQLTEDAKIVMGRGVVRQRLELVEEDGVLILRPIGEPYDA